jgi:hypothetical protein
VGATLSQAPGSNTHRLLTTQNQALGYSFKVEQDKLQEEAAWNGFCCFSQVVVLLSLWQVVAGFLEER